MGNKNRNSSKKAAAKLVLTEVPAMTETEAAAFAAANPAKAAEVLAMVATATAEGTAAAQAATAREMVTGAVPATKSLKIEKVRPAANGITRPSIGGICRAIWDKLDALTAAGSEMPTAKQLAKANNWNLSTVGRQSAEWRKYNGMPAKRNAATAD